GGRAGGGRGGPAAPEVSATCRAQMTRDSIAAAGRGGRGGGRGGLSVADTNTLRWMASQGVAALLLGDASHVGGDIGTNNGASRVSGVPAIPTVHVSQESYG